MISERLCREITINKDQLIAGYDYNKPYLFKNISGLFLYKTFLKLHQSTETRKNFALNIFIFKKLKIIN